MLLRPKTLSFADWQPFLLALLIAGAIAAALAAIGSFLTARAIARPVRRVAEASRSLAEGVSPDPVPVEGSAELALLATSFNEMAEQLQQAREAERNFLLSVSHELKTPLTAIRGYAEALEDGAVPPEEAAATIREEARRLERLVRDLLDLARMNRREFASTASRSTSRRSHARRAALRGRGPLGRSRRSTLSAPKRRGRSATRTGCSRSVQPRRERAPLDSARRPVHVTSSPGVIEVVDTGVGLAPEDVPHAFERFYLHDRRRYSRRPSHQLRPRSRHRQGALRAHGRLGLASRARSARARRSPFGCRRRSPRRRADASTRPRRH